MNYLRTHRITLFERVAAMGLPDIPVVMERIGQDYQQPQRVFPDGAWMARDLGLDLGDTLPSSPELTRRYQVAAYVELNRLKI